MTIPGKHASAAWFGAPPEKYDRAWMSSFTAQISRRLGLLAGPYTIQPQLLLQSPDGTVWQITVSNAGAISATVATHGAVPPPV